MRIARQSLEISMLAEDRGVTGAEKALLLCFALAIVATGGALVARGSGGAAADAQSALAEGRGGSGAALGAGVKPLQSAGDVAAPKGSSPTLGLMLVSLVSFSSDYKDDAPPPPPPPAPPAARELPLRREVVIGRSGGNITQVAIQRTGVLPASDPVLRVLRDGLGSHDVDPGAVNGTVTVWRSAQGGSAVTDARGTVFITQGERRVVIFGDGAAHVSTATSNAQYDAQGRLRSFALLGRRGTTIFLAGSYDFTYGADGQPSRVQVRGGPHEGTWTRGEGGAWTNERGARFSGADGPGTWAGILAGHGRLVGISAAANQAIDDEMTRVRAIWRRYFPDADGLGLTTLRNVVGSGFSGNAGEMQRLAGESGAIVAEIGQLRTLQAQIADSQDPVQIARLSRDFSRRADALRGRIDRFRDDSGRVVGQSMRAGRAWAIAKDVYGLGTAGGPVSGAWNLGKLIKDVVGE